MKGLVIPTIVKMLLVLIALISLLIFWNMIYGKGALSFISIHHTVKAQENVTNEIVICHQLYIQKKCKEFEKMHCEEKLGIRCEE